MIHKLSAFFHRIANLHNTLLLLVLFILTINVLFPLISNMLEVPQENKSPDTEFFYTADQLYQIIDTYDESGRHAAAAAHWTADLIFPIVYLFSFATLISYTMQRGFPKSIWLMRMNLVPLGMLLFDLLENTGLTILFLQYPHRLLWLAHLTSAISAIKWLFAGLTVLLIVTGLCGMMFNANKSKRATTK